MLFNLKAELVRKGLKPAQAIAAVLGCTDKTARGKLQESAPTSTADADKIMKAYFISDNFSFQYLFTSRKIQDEEKCEILE